VSYISCSDSSAIIFANTLIPATDLILNGNGTACFNLEVGIDVTLPACDTMLTVNISTTQESECDRTLHFSYTLNADRYCPTFDPTPNLVAQNCCDPLIKEVIPKGTLQVGDFYADSEGNCWEILQKTGDAPDYTRIVSATYNSCSACITANPCPQNIVFESCCEQAPETFTGSLPGINVGDVFVDTYGFCWSATSLTVSPVSGIVYVDTNYGNVDCLNCLTGNPCPNVFELQPCCKFLGGPFFVTAASLGYTPVVGEVFVDTWGNCWTVSKDQATGQNVTAPWIVHDTSYTSCELCLASNPCQDDTIIYATVRNCCSGDVEVVAVPMVYLTGLETTISFSQPGTPNVYECWEVLGWELVDTPTITFYALGGFYIDCVRCLIANPCPDFYEAIDCCGTLPNEVVLSNGPTGSVFVDTLGRCWTVGLAVAGPATITSSGNYLDCTECINVNPCSA
jgi:hypothetical protein